MVKKNGGESWLRSLRTKSKEDAKTALVSLSGVGPKVADCISLFSLDHLEVVPVDTHVWKMATTYMPNMAHLTTPSPKLFPEINAFFIAKFGDKAGWAHTVLFSAVITKELELENPKNKSKSTKARKRNVDDEDEDFEAPSPKKEKRED